MSSTIEHPVRKSRLSLSLKKSSDEAVAIKNDESDNNEKLSKSSTCRDTDETSCNNMTTTNDRNEEEEIIPCSQTEDNLVFSQKSVPSNCDEAQANIIPEQTKENSSSTETYFSGFSLEHDQDKDSSVGEDKINNIQDDNSTDIFNSPEVKVSKILNERKDSERIEELSKDIKENVIINNNSSETPSSIEVDVCTVSDEGTDNNKMECSNINKETVNVQEECNEIPNSPETKIRRIFKENEGPKEPKCEKKCNDLPPIIKRNVVIADSDEEFEEFAKQKRKSQKKIENTNTSNSQKENSTSKCQGQTKVSSSSKEKKKVLKSHRDKSNVSKTNKEKSVKSLPLKRKLESAAENSDDEFEKPNKQAKKVRSPQRVNMNEEVKKSKKLKKSRKSISESTKNC